MAEQHAAGMSAGVSLNKKKIILFLSIYIYAESIDQIFHDIAYMKLPVTISSRSGFAGYDSATIIVLWIVLFKSNSKYIYLLSFHIKRL